MLENSALVNIRRNEITCQELIPPKPNPPNLHYSTDISSIQSAYSNGP